MTKSCNICKQTKLLKEFGNLKKSIDGKQRYCLTCSREKDRKHYSKSLHRKKAIRVNNKKRIDEARQYVIEYLSSHPCVDCNESDIVVLEFDHKENKYDAISDMVKNGIALERLKSEIEKCDIRCANCHRRKTALQHNYYRIGVESLSSDG